MPDLDVSPYTPMLRRLLRAIGIGGTTALLRWRGGCRLCLPQSPERSELSQYLTYAQAQGLIDEFGAGMWITLPKPDKLYIAARNAEIRSEHSNGDSLATLALRYGLTTRHITNIIASNDDQYADVADESQPGLF
jgi:hypothetical protein